MIENPKIYNIYDFQQPIHGADKHEPGINDIVDHILQQKMANIMSFATFHSIVDKSNDDDEFVDGNFIRKGKVELSQR